jgi:hypothetical protein
MKIDGRCHCGYVTFEAEADPETTTVCNCTDCQTMSGAPLRAVIVTRPGTFVLLSGKPTEYRKTANSGTYVRKVSALTAGRHSIRHQLVMSQKLTTCGLDRCANEMNCGHASKHLFARSKHGSATSTQSRDSTACRHIDAAHAPRTDMHVSYWPGREAPARPAYVCFLGRSGKDLLTVSSFAPDPTRTYSGSRRWNHPTEARERT